MKTTMTSIKDMVDVNTILGDPVETPDGTVIVPVSRVTFGFAAGGSEFDSNNRAQRDRDRERENSEANQLPFGGGSGAGITLNPVGFLTVGKGDTRFVPVGGNAVFDRVLDTMPDLIDKIDGLLKGKRESLTLTH
ncbi:MAG TPA: sporulation protein YtfJ [Firmicutes bacterium]|jgi:sporulation protein YtfJ|nr:sporulation protein YtfJ [Bacillota bacterium]HAW71385.1 sporulation protein YtfJ [Bacillota bacterium]HAZ22107.1 sporulation protein YtfJ [Bacillota bacterium]HBE05510.1 sporulation protein YtfJ [Bacillota bacterium]HBG43077.1 sporulation protein YtfJ [Bacillota bacterium]